MIASNWHEQKLHETTAFHQQLAMLDNKYARYVLLLMNEKEKIRSILRVNYENRINLIDRNIQCYSYSHIIIQLTIIIIWQSNANSNSNRHPI